MLKAISLSKSYNGKKVLDNISFQVEKGEIYCLLGQNGAGKTTTINLFLGFIKPDDGNAFIDGEEISIGTSSLNKKMAYIPETVQLYGNLSGMENLDFFSRIAGFKYPQEKLFEFLTKAGLQKDAHQQQLSSYSKGMRQKVGIAVAIAKNADVIFMDEPTSGLDPKTMAEFTESCKELAATGKTIFMATHNIFNAVNVGSTIGIMKEGTLVQQIRTNDINAQQLEQLYLETI